MSLKFLLIFALIHASCTQKPHQKSLIIAFDGTASMGPNLEQLRLAAKDIVKEYASRPDKPIHNYVLTVFNDPWVDPTIDTTDSNTLLSELDKIVVFSKDNPDWEEKAISGLNQSLAYALQNSVAFVISDAGANDYQLEEEVKKVLMKKQITVNFLIEGDCKDFIKVGCKVYQNLALISGGQFFDMGKNDVQKIIKNLERTLDPNHVKLITIISEAVGSKQHKINVDQSIQEVCAGISGKNPTLVALGPNLERIKLISELTMSTYKFGCMNNTESGEYQFEFGADSSFVAIIDARSNLTFSYGFSIEPVQLHSETNVQPLTGHKNILTIFPSNSTLVRTLSDVVLVLDPSNLKDKATELNYPLRKVNDGGYATEAFEIPSVPFKIKMRGLDAQGIPISREISLPLTAVTGSAPEVTVEATDYELCATEQIELKCRVKSQTPVKVSWTFGGKILKEESANQSKELSLNFNSLKVTDKGIYKCEATNNIGPDSKIVSLSVLKVPKVKIITATTELTEFLEYSLKCEVTETDESPTIQWLKDGNVLLNASTVYNFTALRKNDGKSISCEVKNKKCTVNDSKFFQINYLPVFKDAKTEPIVHKTFNFGAEFTFDCETDRNRLRHQLKWFLNTFDNKTVEITEQQNNDKIDFSATKASDGVFECVIDNEIEKVRRQFNITVNALESPKITKTKQIFTFNETDRAELICECQKCLPVTKATWIYESSPNIEVSHDENPSLNHYQSFLHFNIVNRAQGGGYKCRFENSKGSDETEVKLVIQTPPKVENVTVLTDSMLSKVDKKVEVLEGKNFEFSCHAESFPAPAISWNFEGNKIKDGNSLKIFNASGSHEGAYECIAENIVKTTSKKFQVFLNFPPKRNATKSSERHFTHNTEASLTCDIYGRPEPEIKWKFDDDEIYAVSKHTRYEFMDGRRVLKFTASDKDEGTFSCEGKNDFGSISMDFKVIVKTTPIIKSPHDEDVKITKGSTLKLTCEATSFPEPEIKFLRDDKAIASSTVLTKADVEASDAGIYICMAKNAVGVSEKTFNVTVVEPPTITSHFKDVTLVEDNETFNVTCTANAVPEATIKWFFEDSTAMEEGAVLRLTTQSDRGVYTCVAENSVKSEKRSFYANIRRLNPFKNISAIDRAVKVKENDDFELLCPYKNYNTLKWNLNGQKLPSDVDHKEENNRLTVKSIKRSHKGAFSCLVTDPKDNFTFEYDVDVLAVPVITPSWIRNNVTVKYPANSDIEEHEFKMGDNLALSCDANGNPKPTVKWFKANSQVKEGKVLAIDDLKSEHSGVFSCTAQNSQGESKKFFSVDVASAPHADDLETKIFMQKPGKEVVLDCSDVEGSPKPNFFWFKDKERLDGKNDPRLVIKKVALEDDGGYLCLAFNNYGATEKEFKVSVLEPPTIIEPVDEQLILRNSTFSLTCVARGNPTPQFWWSSTKTYGMTGDVEHEFKAKSPIYFDEHGKIIKNFEDHKITKGLTGMSKLSKIDSRTFKFETFVDFKATMQNQSFACRTSNSEGSDYKKITVLRLEKPHMSKETDDEFSDIKLNFIEGESLIIECPLVGSPNPKYIWRKGGANPDDLELIDDERTLYADKALGSHSGFYTCIARNAEGRQMINFEVVVNTKPKLINFEDEKMEEIKVKKGQDAMLQCWTEGNPKPEIHWVLEKIGKEIENKILSERHNVLIVKNVEQRRSYFCHINNTFGSVQKLFVLTPYFPPEFRVNIPVSNVSVSEDEKVVLSCDLQAYPKANVTWTKDSKPLVKGHVNLYANKRQLEVSKAQLTHNGSYTCLASNEHGSSSKTFHLFVQPAIEYERWTEWSQCGGPCDRDGSQYRFRYCRFRNSVKNVQACPGEVLQYRSCENPLCLSEWSDWTECPSCGHEKFQSRSRKCLAGNKNDCKQSLTETRACNVTKCEEKSDWSEWSATSNCPKVKCYPFGSKPTQKFIRTCNNPGGCTGENFELRECKVEYCRGNHWDKWSDWSSCEALKGKPCGYGQKIRTRMCLAGERKCRPGLPYEKIPCKLEKC